MTLIEFKAWFEGFCEGITDIPTKEQWDKIKAKVTTLTAENVLPTYYRYPKVDPDVWPVKPKIKPRLTTDIICRNTGTK